MKNDPKVGDLAYRKNSPKRNFFIKPAFYVVKHEDNRLNEDFWNTIWHMSIQQGIRALLWLPFYDCLLGNLNKFKRHTMGYPNCIICAYNEDSILHILCDCPVAQMIWSKIGVLSNSANFFPTSFKRMNIQ